jgi:hypothetical protein
MDLRNGMYRAPSRYLEHSSFAFTRPSKSKNLIMTSHFMDDSGYADEVVHDLFFLDQESSIIHCIHKNHVIEQEIELGSD